MALLAPPPTRVYMHLVHTVLGDLIGSRAIFDAAMCVRSANACITGQRRAVVYASQGRYADLLTTIFDACYSRLEPEAETD